MFPASIFCLGLAISSFLSITVPLTVARSVAADDWTLVFDDEFTDENDSLADWDRFGGTSSKTTGRKGRGLLIETEGGLAEPAYAGAVNHLGGGIKPDEIVTAEAVWRAIGDQPSDAVLAVKLEFKDLNGGTISSEETLVALGEALDGKWETTKIVARVPSSAASTDLVLVLVPGQQKGTLRVLVDEVSATRAAPPLDLLAGAGGFESSDGGAVG